MLIGAACPKRARPRTGDLPCSCIPPLSRIARRAGLVTQRQTFVRRCQNYVVIHQGRGAGWGSSWQEPGHTRRRASSDGGARPPTQAQALKRITVLPVAEAGTTQWQVGRSDQCYLLWAGLSVRLARTRGKATKKRESSVSLQAKRK